MNATMLNILAIGLVGIGVLIELNLMHMTARSLRSHISKAGMYPSARRRRSRHERSTRSKCTSVTATTAICAMHMTSVAVAAEKHIASDDLNARTELTFRADDPLVTECGVISTDRPSFSDGTGFVPTGHFQLETGYTYTLRDREDMRTHKHNAPEVLARVGLLDDRLEIRCMTTGYVWTKTSTHDGGESFKGWSDVSLGIKLKLHDQQGWVPRLALGAQSTLGTGSEEVSNRVIEPTAKLLWSYDMQTVWGEKWKGCSVGGNANIAWPAGNGERFTQVQGSIYGAFPISSRCNGFAEYYVVGPNSKGSDAAHFADVGGNYLLSDRVQFDARVGFGLNREADSLFLGFGFSFLF